MLVKDLRNMGGKSDPQTPPDMGGGTERDVQELMARYGSKSPAELLGELKAGKQSGLLDDAMLSNAAAKMAPMLSAEQRARLNEILKQLGQ